MLLGVKWKPLWLIEPGFLLLDWKYQRMNEILRVFSLGPL